MTDFEPALEKAIKIEFNDNTVQKGCFFHFTQSIYRQIQSLGLSSAYLNNLVFRSVTRQLMALALVPEELVPSLFSNLIQEVDDYERDELAGIFKYFNDNWMRQIQAWNVFKVIGGPPLGQGAAIAPPKFFICIDAICSFGVELI
ncbi:unnamed protein product [Rotaria magnacalcarata]|uniref:MULE transposase domain-containing protein n=2 Tax=Rotaria magnacalcarata TaxID=392030 RepID=A0A815XJV2_9BILA|nr:unnamed protein product [Rotaria magnacalcarata]CAF4204103.1 unnamed protein product [Rotaria magnacalcarata]